MAVGMGGEPLDEFSASPRLMGCWEEEEEKLQGGCLSPRLNLCSAALSGVHSVCTKGAGVKVGCGANQRCQYQLRMT